MLREATPDESYIGLQIAGALASVPCQKVQFVEGREWILMIKNEVTGECFEVTVQGNVDPGAWDEEATIYDWDHPAPNAFADRK